MAAELRQKRWKVNEKNRIITSEGLKKPDIICQRQNEVWVIDTQVVGFYKPLNELHKDKANKYKKDEIRIAIASERKVPVDSIKFTSCTISYRGVWSQRSLEDLLSLGLTKGFLAKLTTMVLQGTHTNWTRFNSMTSRVH